MLNFFKKKVTVVTHNGPFHSDDLFAMAVVGLVLESQGKRPHLVRTRDEKAIADADIVFDVGGEYDPVHNRYDHHQHGGAGARENGIPYASIGLVWKHFGMELCDQDEQVWQKVDEKLIQPIDADDVGISLYELNEQYDVSPYTLQFAFKSFYSTWNESERFDEIFQEALVIAKQILKNEIHHAKARIAAAALVEQDYEQNTKKEIIILSQMYPWKSVLSKKPEPLFVVYPRHDGTWGIEGVPVDEGREFEIRKQFPVTWAGLRTDELVKVSGVEGARFCHNGRWFCVTETKEGALKLAEIALSL